MKTILLGVIAILMISHAGVAHTTDERQTFEKQIRECEEELVRAVLLRDVAKLDDLFAKDLIVNNPGNRLSTKDEVMQMVRQRRISYSSYKANIEKILIIGTTVFVMGSETATPIDDAAFAGKTVERRFTNVWMLNNDRWQMTARHANVISSN